MDPVFRVEKASRCKVCQSALCDVISRMLLEGKPLRAIVQFAKSGDLAVSTASLRRHKHHIVCAVSEAVEDALEDEKAERFAAVARGDLASDFDFLDMVRNQGVRVIDQALHPEKPDRQCLTRTVEDGQRMISLAIRAVAIRRHVEGTSSFERELAELLARAKQADLGSDETETEK